MFFRLRTLPKQLWDRTPRSSSLHNQNIDFVTCIIQPITLFHEKILRIAHKNEVKQKTGGDLRVRLINCVLIAKFRLLYRQSLSSNEVESLRISICSTFVSCHWRVLVHFNPHSYSEYYNVVPSEVLFVIDPLLCFLIVGIRALGVTIPLSLLMKLG